MTEDNLANGLMVTYEYDLVGRVTKITNPDSSWVEQFYQGPHLKEVKRYNIQGKCYTHTYSPMDLSGNLISAQLMGEVGEIKYDYDKMNRLTSIASPL